MSQTYPPRVFIERVRILLITRELAFLAATKSSQQYETTVFVAGAWAQI